MDRPPQAGERMSRCTLVTKSLIQESGFILSLSVIACPCPRPLVLPRLAFGEPFRGRLFSGRAGSAGAFSRPRRLRGGSGRRQFSLWRVGASPEPATRPSRRGRLPCGRFLLDRGRLGLGFSRCRGGAARLAIRARFTRRRRRIGRSPLGQTAVTLRVDLQEISRRLGRE